MQVQERNSAFTAGLGRRLPSPEGSDQTSSTEFVEGDNALPETEEEPVDFYRLERTGKVISCLWLLFFFLSQLRKNDIPTRIRESPFLFT